MTFLTARREQSGSIVSTHVACVLRIEAAEAPSGQEALYGGRRVWLAASGGR